MVSEERQNTTRATSTTLVGPPTRRGLESESASAQDIVIRRHKAPNLPRGLAGCGATYLSLTFLAPYSIGAGDTGRLEGSRESGRRSKELAIPLEHQGACFKIALHCCS